MGLPQTSCQSTAGTVTAGNPCNVSAEATSTGLADWAPLLNFQPPSDVKSKNMSRFTSTVDTYPAAGFQPIEWGHGPCNMDMYVIDILTPPSCLEDGSPFTAEGFLDAVRRNLNNFFDARSIWFEPYEDEDGVRFATSSPLASVMHFYMGGKTIDPFQHISDAGVVCTDFASDHWIFSTLQIPLMNRIFNGVHPVNGNRRFGVGVRKAGEAWSERYKGKIPVRDQDTLFFYTRGVDRCSSIGLQAMSDSVFTGGHLCWMELIQRVAHKLERLGGSVDFVGLWVSERYDWDWITKPENKLWIDQRG
jgi:hypothetical protein